MVMISFNKEFEKIVKECESIMSNCGFIVPSITYSFNTRATRRLGQCKRMSGKYYINITESYFKSYMELGRRKNIMNVILHELCHALPNGMNHGEQWKAYAKIVNTRYGYKISRLAESDDVTKELALKRLEKKVIKYKFVCRGCGQIIERTKMSNFVKYYETYKCGRCGKGFDRVL